MEMAVILLLLLLFSIVKTVIYGAPSESSTSTSVHLESLEEQRAVDLAEWTPPVAKQAINYEQYIISSKWLENPARVSTLKRDLNACRMCLSEDHIQVHHITYKDLGNESVDQLATLCNDCHNYTHNVAGMGAGYYPPVRKPIV